MKTDGLKKLNLRTLKPGEEIPNFPPRKYNRRGYVLLRWKIASREYVEIKEHRVCGGRVVIGIVHHINGKRNDNRPENLKLCCSAREHNFFHRKYDRQSAATLYKSGKTTVEIAKIMNCYPGNVSTFIKECGVEARFGIGKPANNRIAVDEKRIVQVLKENRRNIADTMRRCNVTRMVVRRIIRENGIKRIPLVGRCASCGKDRKFAENKICKHCFAKSVNLTNQ